MYTKIPKQSKTITFFFGFLILLSSLSCKKTTNKSSELHSIKTETNQENILFTKILAKDSGINFVNNLEETLESNYYQYMYSYIGGGVAAGDINNDGLIDLYFTSNTNQDILYLNQGDFKFKDITISAGILNPKGFNTGVTMVDINNDGYLDIYVSRGGRKDENNQFANLLYINNGDSTFTEKASEMGLAGSNRTIQATFFDYDNDNDLDVYISNTPDITGKIQIQNLEKIQNDPKTLLLKGSDKLYNNDGTGHFTDVSEKSGLQFDIGFGLNPQVGDLNNDGWLDVYVCNDFSIPDLAYLNNGDGTFTESRDKLFKHMSFNSMGGDMADINNDGLPDLMTLDMNPEDYIRSKTTMAMTSVGKFEKMVEMGYHHQYMNNMLQLNNGNGTFSEIGQMAKIAKSDWSWSILSADFDLDGYNDIFITNGVFRDVIDRDTNNEILKILRKNRRKPTAEDFLQFTKMFPQQKLDNYFFKNNGDNTFTDTSQKWMTSQATFSNGAIYADLDNDGDLDIVVNNINDQATVLQNNTIAPNNNKNFLSIKFLGKDNNKLGLGTVVNLLFKDGTKQTRRLINTRGFLSSVSNNLYFGLGNNTRIDTVQIVWLDGKKQNLTHVASNQFLIFDYKNAEKEPIKPNTSEKPLFKKTPFDYKHKDPYFNDYSLQVLLPHKLSQTGPSATKADVNNDGLEDIYLGGGKGQAGKLFLANANGSFRPKKIPDFILDEKFEDQDACFFDADNDGDLDLYVVSGSYEFFRSPHLLQDRLYLNDGKGQFLKSKNRLPKIQSSGSVVVAKDYDNDGDMDLFVGGRIIPGKYPYAPKSYLLINDNATFKIATPDLAPELENIGMVTDAVWVDINNDNLIDLVVTGEWMGIEVFINKNNQLVRSKDYETLSSAKGWWNTILIADIDNDGDKDIVAGNLGLNYKFHASTKEPFHVYTTDFDLNGVEDIILAKKYKGREVPVRGKSCMTQQLPFLSQKIGSYNDFANRDLFEIVGEKLDVALHYQATEFRSGIFRNNGTEGFIFEPFMNQVQQSLINSIIYDDIDSDGIKDLLLAGNNHMSEVETTRSDAGIGSFLKGSANGNFSFIPYIKSGFFANKDVRKMVLIKNKNNKWVFVVNNNDQIDLFRVSN